MFTTAGSVNAVGLDCVGCMELSFSDHSLIYGVVNSCVRRKVNILRMVRCFGKCNLEKLVTDLDAAPWQVIHLMIWTVNRSIGKFYFGKL